MSGTGNKPHTALICGVLAIITFAVYFRATFYGSVFLDDHLYVADEHIKAGLSWAGVKWAFQSVVAGNWHPLTVLSHMLDLQIFGSTPRAFHTINALFHTANTCLLFVWLRRMTGAIWKSALVAALFAWHPTHVESVAWISERKDVLSAFFWLLTLITYDAYRERSKIKDPRSKVFFILTLFCFALGLLSKPMVVTLPFVLLLMDFWDAHSTDPQKPPRLPWTRLVLEKIPFFILSAAACGATLWAQKQAGAIESFEKRSFFERGGNALVSYIRYLWKLICPVDLGMFYRLPLAWPAWQIVGALLILIVVTLLALKFSRGRRWLPVGWFWFLGTLVPVVGLIQVGRQSIADRYTYLPSIGFFIVVVWLLEEWAVYSKENKAPIGISIGALAACLGLTWVQIGYWKDSEVLFKHDIDLVGYNYLACGNYGAYLLSKHRDDEALFYLNKSAEDSPLDAPYFNRSFSIAYFDLGNDAFEKGDYVTAAQQFSKAIAYFPQTPDAHQAFGKTLMLQGNSVEAVAQFHQAAELAKDWAQPHLELASWSASQGDLPGALAEYEIAAKDDPANPKTQSRLAALLAQQGKTSDAVAHYHEAARLYREALHTKPDAVDALNNLAWMLAVNPNANIRNGAEAVKLARHACEVTEWKIATAIGTLAAAYAEAGQFDDAIKTARQAREIALAAGDKPIADRNDELLKLYESGKAYREQY